jgi:hypothetical protein
VLCFVCLPPVSCVSHVVSDSGCYIPCCVLLSILLYLVCPMLSVTGCFIPWCVLFAFLLCLVCPMLSVTLDVPFRVVFCLPSSCVLCVPCCQWLLMFHSVLCFVWLPPVSCVSHVVSDSGCSIPCCVLFAFLLFPLCPMLSVTLDVPFRVVHCLPSSSVLCVPCCQWLDVSFRVVYCLPYSCVLCVPCCQGLWMFHFVLCFVCRPPISCVSHVVSDSECSLKHPESLTTWDTQDTGLVTGGRVLFRSLYLVCPMLSVTLDVRFRVVFCLPSS